MKILHRTLIENEQRTGRRIAKMPSRHQKPRYQPRPDIPFRGSVKRDRVARRTLPAPVDEAENILRKRPASDGFVYPTDHLRKFKILEKEIGLYGGRYKPIIKSVWYILMGQVIKDKIIQLGGVKTDCRNNFAYALPSGWGKKHIETVLRKVCIKLGDSFSAPTSFHPEQLVGKVKPPMKKGEPYKEIKGYFNDDLVIFNDAIDLVRGKEFLYKESQKYLCTALDCIGDNAVTKGGTEIPRNKRLKYYPRCTVIFIFQPFSLDEEVFLGGLFRRLPTIYLPFEERDQDEFSKKTAGHGEQNRAMPSLDDYLIRLKERNPDPPAIKDGLVKERFDELHLMLLDYGKSFGSKSANFTNMVDFNLQNWFLRTATVLAYSQSKKEVEIFDVEMAFVDLLEFWHSTLTFVEMKVSGSLSYGETWQGATGKDQEILNWLWEEGAVSDDSSKISIQGYINKISQVLGKTEDSSRNIYRRHRKKGWISSGQLGSYKSVVYLNFKPLLTGMGGEGGRVVSEYVTILKKHSLYPKSSSAPFVSTSISTSDINKLVEQEEELTPSPVSEEQKPPLDTTLPPSPPSGDTPPLAIEEDDVINPFSAIKVD